MHQNKRASDEFILLMMSAAGVIAVLPFAIMRFMGGEWMLFILDVTLIAGLGSLGAFVNASHRIRGASIAVSTLCLVAIVGTIYIKGPAQIFWAFPAVLIVFYLLRPIEALLMNLLTISILVPKLIGPMSSQTLMTVAITLVATIVFSFAFSSQTSSQRDQLLLLATKDPLTGASNRRALGSKLRELIATHHRRKVIASMLLVDIDEFKGINDAFGHAIGDEVLVDIVRVMQQRVRETDTIYRIGGEEFLIIAEGACGEIADTLAEDLRTLVERTKLIEDHPVTVSIGIAELNAGETTDDWLRRADSALYAAKNAGRNRAMSADTKDDISNRVTPIRG